LTFDLENLFINTHSRDEYLWQVSLNLPTPPNKYRDIVLHETHVNGQKTTDGYTDDLHNIPPPPVVGKGIKRCAFGPIQLLKVSN